MAEGFSHYQPDSVHTYIFYGVIHLERFYTFGTWKADWKKNKIYRKFSSINKITVNFFYWHKQDTHVWSQGMNIGLIQLRFDILTVIIVCFVVIEVSLIIYSTYFRRVDHSAAPVSAFLWTSSFSLSLYLSLYLLNVCKWFPSIFAPRTRQHQSISGLSAFQDVKKHQIAPTNSERLMYTIMIQIFLIQMHSHDFH